MEKISCSWKHIPTLLNQDAQWPPAESWKYFNMCCSISYNTNLSAKAVCLPKHMIVALEFTTLPHVRHAWSNEPDTVDEPRVDSTTHGNEEWVEKNIGIPWTRMENPITSHNQSADGVVNTIQLSMGCQDQSNKQTHQWKFRKWKKTISKPMYKYQTITKCIRPNF